MGWILLALLILLSNTKEWVKNLSFVLIFIWAVVLAFSRIVVGAHYASDVLFGSFFIIMTFVIFKNQFVSSQKNKPE
ncbi:MAG TPA: phosphatase PAP2 family protein, partial [Ignavibacteriaceae bacterium]